MSYATSVKYAVNNLLCVSDRIIGQLMSFYRSIFVLGSGKISNFYRDQGFICFGKGNNERAIEFLDTYLENFNPTDPEVLFHAGLAHVRMQQYAEAIPYFRKAEALVGKDPDIVLELATCFVKMEDYPEAIDYLKQAIKIRPAHGDLYYMLGTSYENIGDSDKAFAMYQRAIQINPRQPLFYHALGFAYESCGKHEEAITCFKKAMELEKNR